MCAPQVSGNHSSTFSGARRRRDEQPAHSGCSRCRPTPDSHTATRSRSCRVPTTSRTRAGMPAHGRTRAQAALKHALAATYEMAPAAALAAAVLQLVLDHNFEARVARVLLGQVDDARHDGGGLEGQRARRWRAKRGRTEVLRVCDPPPERPKNTASCGSQTRFMLGPRGGSCAVLGQVSGALSDGAVRIKPFPRLEGGKGQRTGVASNVRATDTGAPRLVALLHLYDFL